MFSLKCDEGVQPTSFKADQKIYMDPTHFLTLDRFLPKPKAPKGQSQGGMRGGSGFRGGRGGGNFRGGNRGGNFRGANRGGGFRGGNRGGNFRRGG